MSRARLLIVVVGLVLSAVAIALLLRSIDLSEALRALGRLTGQVGVEAVLDRIFADFCIGK